MIPSYSEHVNQIVDYGDRGAPRGLPCYEALNVQVTADPGEIPQRDKLILALGFGEMFQLLAGQLDKDLFRVVAPRANQDLFGDQSAYGPRILGQVEAVIAELRRDPLSRRCALIVGRPEECATARLPCTTTVQFLLRGGRLHAMVALRSSDAVWGLPYDVVQFGALVMAVAHLVSAAPGKMHLTLGSAHVYESTLHLAPLGEPASRLNFFVDFGAFAENWGDVQRWAELGIGALKRGEPGHRRVEHLHVYESFGSRGTREVEKW